MADPVGFESVHNFAGLRRQLLLTQEGRAPAERAPNALAILAAILPNAAIGSTIGAFVWGMFRYLIFGTSAFTMLFSAVAVGFILAVAGILIDQDADDTFDWRMPGATMREYAAQPENSSVAHSALRSPPPVSLPSQCRPALSQVSETSWLRRP